MKRRKLKPIVLMLIASIAIVSNYNKVNAYEHKVMIDPGHGGNDNGSVHNSYIEDNINLQIANEVKELLKKENIDVEMTRTDDVYVSLSQRAIKSNESDVDLFVSIHQNGSVNPYANGYETYYMGENSKELAKHIQKSVLEETNAKDRGIKKGNLQVLRDNKKTAVLIECGFISNQKEGYKLSTKDYQEKLAKGIVEGIKEYLNVENSTNKENSNNQESLNNATCLNDVNIMSDRGSNFKVIGTLQKGSSVEIIDTKFDWHKIKYNGEYGYVSAVYVK